ncbi:cation:proton antiporter [Halomicrococcus sp. SG-WS-1]|uniref:cation:proton antiporter n=1 Tax=Halomicrococcus sp. SG-WS-1 TaxID=3439057 RepID=UPI003F7A6390
MTPFLELGVVLGAVAVAGGVAVRLGQSVVPAYIVAGIVVGPHAPTRVAGVPLALVAESEFVAVFADLGVVLLLFFLGLHVDADRLLGDWDRVVGAGVVDLGCNAAVGVALGWLFGFSLLETLFLVGVVYISSSAIVTKALLEQGWIANRESEPILGSLVFEDVVVAVYLTVLSTLVLGGGSASNALASLAAGFGLVAGVAAVGWYATGALERLVAARSDELFLLRVLAVAVLVAGTAATLGVSKGIAAFFVGGALGATDEAERVERALVPVRDLFAATFFLAVGLATPVSALVEVAGLLAAALVATTASKLVSGVVSGRIYGLDDRRSLRVGLGLVARGEFSLVLAALARASPTPVEGVPEFAVGYVLATSVLGTLLLRHEPTVAALAGVTDRVP